REGGAMFGISLLLWLVVRSVRRRSGRFVWSALGIGALLGAFAMFHESGLVLALTTIIVLTVSAAGSSVRPALVTAGACVTGYLIGFSPLLVRNVMVGATPLSVSSRAKLTLALANLPASAEGGVVFAAPGPQFRQLMDASGGTIWGVVREVWRSYDGQHSTLISHWAHRAAAICWTVEIPDNTSFEFHRMHVSIARL